MWQVHGRGDFLLRVSGHVRQPQSEVPPQQVRSEPQEWRVQDDDSRGLCLRKQAAPLAAGEHGAESVSSPCRRRLQGHLAHQKHPGHRLFGEFIKWSGGNGVQHTKKVNSTQKI